jgi:hypothetical protein
MSPPATSAAKRAAPARKAAQRPTRPRVHRRVSGPAAPARGRVARPRATAPAQLRPLPVLGAFALRAGRSLQDSSFLDRLLRGRMWIGLLGVLLIGLVALNVSLLKLNAEAGQNAEIAKKLRVENADLRGKVSRLGSGGRLQDAAAALGLVMPRANDVNFLTSNLALDARRAAHRAAMLPWTDTSDIVSATPEEPLAPPAVALPAPVSAAGTAGATAGTNTGTTGAAAVAPQPITPAAQTTPTPTSPAPATGGTPSQGTTPP